MTDKWHIYKWGTHWVAFHVHRWFEADTWEDALRYATDQRRDEI